MVQEEKRSESVDYMLVGVEMSGTYDRVDIAEMATRGLVVVTLAWGQGVYRNNVAGEVSDE